MPSISTFIPGRSISKTAAARASALPGSDHLGRRFSAQHQPQGSQEQALARAGFPGPGAVAALKLDVHVFDQRQVLYGQFSKHGSLDRVVKVSLETADADYQSQTSASGAG